MKNVVIVESPAKANTIGKYLGEDFVVLASYGHIRDLPSKDGSVDPEQDFAMKWEIDVKAKKRIDEITKAVKKCETVLLATDPDREGEAISWHVYEVLKEGKAINNQTVKRVVFNEITKRAIVEAVQNPRQINMGLVDAYMARRALDYLVGFSLSPVLWRKLPGSRSAGRVQSVALRLICEREAEIEIFKPQEYWSVESIFETSQKVPFSTNLVEFQGKKIERLTLQNEAQAQEVVNKIRSSQFSVKSLERREVKRNPHPPFITSTLQQEASRKLGYSATKTMQIAQRLYEGIQLGGETVGLITYMRTDGVSMAQEAVASMREFIQSEYGANYLPEAPRVYKSKTANAQEAHEAIRPTDVTKTPESVKDYLDYDQLRLYELIWKRALSCQMANAVFDQMSVEISSSDKVVALRATGSVMIFDGFIKLYQEDKDEKSEIEDADKRLPKMHEGENLDFIDVNPEQHFTKPPPRFTEAGLIKKLEELGIGRPSTYASIIRILQDRSYVRMDGKRFIPEDRGILVTTFLCNFFEKYIQYGFTADLEDKLDDIAHEKITSKIILNNFWKDFKEAIASTKDLSITLVLDKLNEVLEEHFFPRNPDNPDPNHDPRKCPSCATGQLGLRLGKYGAFIGCSTYPECRYTRQLKVSESDVSLDNFATSPVELGIEPESGKKVLICKGPYGFYVQLGEEEVPEPKKETDKEIKALEEKAKDSKAEDSSGDDSKTKKKKTKKATKPKVAKPKRTSIPQSMNPSELTLEGALSLLSLPRELGLYPETGDMISTSIGRFGPYLKFGSTFVSLKAEDDVLTVSLERAIELITASGKKRIELGEYKKKPVAVQKGRFGFFVVYNKLRAAIPKTKDAESLTLDEAIELIDKKLDKGKKEKEEKAEKDTDKTEEKAKPKTSKSTKTTKAKIKSTVKK